ncbi:unnamed protein product [Polarella glacialis]|uniref:Uncharacterized protein n=1 Tax=Polarella glacialis TaxID=89957 RepID=A0A813HDX2_POLGL|nr:unnamed protein product [Polarella glacialis]
MSMSVPPAKMVNRGLFVSSAAGCGGSISVAPAWQSALGQKALGQVGLARSTSAALGFNDARNVTASVLASPLTQLSPPSPSLGSRSRLQSPTFGTDAPSSCRFGVQESLGRPPAGGFVPDMSDPMDRALSDQLRQLHASTVARLGIKRLGSGRYLIDARPVSFRSGRGSGAEILVFEDEVRGDGTGQGANLAFYISQAANVSASLRGHSPGVSAVGRIPQDMRLTFRSAGGSPLEGENFVPSEDARRESMRKAVEEAGLRRVAAEALERLLAAADFSSQPHGPMSPRAFGAAWVSL